MLSFAFTDAGEVVAAIAVTEPSGGSDAAHLRTTARRVDAGYALNGEKIGITHAVTAEIAIVYARQPDSTGARGVSAFLVPLRADGVSRTPTDAMGCLPLGWGIWATPTSSRRSNGCAT
jgi:cyclohexanecarboxyl-CoA dehydrogenase